MFKFFRKFWPYIRPVMDNLLRSPWISVEEGFIIKSGLRWHAYDICLSMAWFIVSTLKYFFFLNRGPSNNDVSSKGEGKGKNVRIYLVKLIIPNVNFTAILMY